MPPVLNLARAAAAAIALLSPNSPPRPTYALPPHQVMMCCAGYMNEHNNEDAEDAHVELILARKEAKKLRSLAGAQQESSEGPSPAGGGSSRDHGNMVAPAELQPEPPSPPAELQPPPPQTQHGNQLQRV